MVKLALVLLTLLRVQFKELIYLPILIDLDHPIERGADGGSKMYQSPSCRARSKAKTGPASR